MTLPPRKNKNSGRQNEGKRWPQHLQFVRGYACAVGNKGGVCGGRIEAAHVDFAGGKGVGMKVDDRFTIPLCLCHHADQHQIGWSSFQKIYRIDALDIAAGIARVSPSLIKAARALGHDAGPQEEME